jgi:hypothetical protein
MRAVLERLAEAQARAGADAITKERGLWSEIDLPPSDPSGEKTRRAEGVVVNLAKDMGQDPVRTLADYFRLNVVVRSALGPCAGWGEASVVISLAHQRSKSG